jgi:hypothetical protein
MSSITISAIILPIYQKYAPKFAKIGGNIDLSIKDPSLPVKNPKMTEVTIINLLTFILKSTKNPHLVISSTDKYLTIKEENTLLLPDFKTKITELEGVKASSRIGFGTKIQFPLL